MLIPRLHRINWLKTNFFNRNDFWHIFPKGDELNIKSALEILVYVLIIVIGWNLFMKFQNIKERSIEVRVENLFKNETSELINDSLGTNIANIKILIPHTDKTKDKSLRFQHSFFTEHSILNFSKNFNVQANTNYHFDNYFETLKFVNEKYSDIDFKDKSCFSKLLSDKDISGDLYKNEFDTLTYNINKIIFGSIYKGVEDYPDSFFGDNHLYMIFKSKYQAENLSDEIKKLKESFFNILRDSIGQDSINLIKENVLSPLNYFEIKADISSSINWWVNIINELPTNINNRLLFGKQYPTIEPIKETMLLTNVKIDSSKVCLSSWWSGTNSEAPGFGNKVNTYIKGTEIVSRPYSLYDISRAKYKVKLITGSIDSINLVLDFIGPCTFGKMYPEPDIIDMNSITFTDQWKILKIRDKGLEFYVEFEEFEKTQHIRLFIIEAVISGLIIILLTFALIGLYKIINRNRLKKEMSLSSKEHRKGLMRRRRKR